MFTPDNPKREWHAADAEVRELVTAGVPDGPTSYFNLVATCRNHATALEIAQRHNANL